MWLYRQSTGELIDPQGNVVARGYSGFGPGKNNPTMQKIHGIGPIPVGVYTVGSAYDSPTHGPYCLPLIPDAQNVMFGRDGFLMHGDSIEHPGNASQGCIIQTKMIRVLVGTSHDRKLQVTE